MVIQTQNCWHNEIHYAANRTEVVLGKHGPHTVTGVGVSVT